MKIYTLRYMWKIKGSDSVNFKVITDTEEGLEQFEEALLQFPDLVSAGSEYIQEYDCARVGVFNKIFNEDV
ncbi:hypothetical protein [Peromfec virus RodF8_38]|uniref:Uncharacterized protein n=1 Tax=Peromfec virus RodF8_38 TaxID=2929373 RepID=A0A976R7Q6_9VIRU|nr:hypothetical protein [Peromfec virus RodF8_38]